MLNGAGSVKFVNNGQDVVKIYLQVEALGNSVAFDFEENFQKEIQVWTTRLKEFLTMATGQDHITVSSDAYE